MSPVVLSCASIFSDEDAFNRCLGIEQLARGGDRQTTRLVRLRGCVYETKALYPIAKNMADFSGIVWFLNLLDVQKIRLAPNSVTQWGSPFPPAL